MQFSIARAFSILFCLAALATPILAEAKPRRLSKVRVTDENKAHFFSGSSGYSCYRHPRSGAVLVGKLRTNRRNGSQVWRSLKTKGLSKRARKIEVKISRLRERGASERKLSRLESRLARHQEVLLACDTEPENGSPPSNDGGGEEPGEGGDGQPGETPSEIPVPLGPAPTENLPSNNLRVDVAKYLGVEGSDSARGSVFTARDELVVAGNFISHQL